MIINMKRGTIIGIAFIVYIVAMAGMFLGVDAYVKSKDKRLRNEMHNKIKALFEDRRQYVDIAYSGYKVGYEIVSIPAKPKPVVLQDEESKKVLGDMNKEALKTWNDNYGNLNKMYRTHYKKSDWAGPYDYEDGWNLCILEHDYEGVYQTWIFPYAVGYIKQDYYLGDNYLPSVDSAVNDAFEFFTSNEKSTYYSTFEKGSVDRVWSAIYDAQNEYYYMAEDERPRFNRIGSPLFEEYPKDGKYHNVQNGYMYNGLYKVFVASTQPKTWTIKKWYYEPDEKDKKDLLMYWTIGITTILLFVVIPLWMIEAKHKKIKDESLYDKLKRMCNPSNFMNGDNYDKGKIEKANAIYKRLLEINGEESEVLNELQLQAVKDLGINLIDAEKLADLKEKVNPKNYMTPYNPDKVTLANELYAILTKEGLTYHEMTEVEEEAKQL